MKIKAKNVLSLLLAVLFLSYYCATALFFHTHQLDGKSVTHSHPYLPSASHTHSAASFQLIDGLSHPDFVFVFGLALPMFMGIASRLIFNVVAVRRVAYIVVPYCRLRPPPVY